MIFVYFILLTGNVKLAKLIEKNAAAQETISILYKTECDKKEICKAGEIHIMFLNVCQLQWGMSQFH